MISFLFWNLMGNQSATWIARSVALRRHLNRIVSSLGVDVVLLAESAFDPSEIVGALNGGQPGDYCFPASNSRRIQLFTRLPATAVTDQDGNGQTGSAPVGSDRPEPELLSGAVALGHAQPGKVYPVTVTAECFAPKSANPMEALNLGMLRMTDPTVIQRKAATDEEFINLVRQVLRSEEVRALIHSLIARINQEAGASQGNGPGEPEGHLNPAESQVS